MFERWPDFKPVELLSPDGLRLWEDKKVLPLNVDAVDRLQAFRDFVGHPIRCNFSYLSFRGFRSPRENYRVHDDTWTFSFHCQGRAFDIDCPKLSLQELHSLALEFDWPGIGLYPKRGFIHLDDRDGPKARWEGKS